jgi:hypothetical protein
MKKTIIFLTKKPNEIPPVATENSNAFLHGMSEFYFGKYLTHTGLETIGLVCYDFKLKIWRSCTNGFSQLVEYYVNDANFNKWMHSESQDLDLFLDIFNSMDECDR